MILDQVHNMYAINKVQPYLEHLYKAVFSTAYYGLLRIGEIADSEHSILAKNVHIGINKNKILLLLETSKMHCCGDKPQMIKIVGKSQRLKTCKTGVAGGTLYCSFTLIKQYLANRPDSISSEENFFVFADRSPIPPNQIRSILHATLTLARLDAQFYCFHAFRAGQIL